MPHTPPSATTTHDLRSQYTHATFLLSFRRFLRTPSLSPLLTTPPTTTPATSADFILFMHGQHTQKRGERPNIVNLNQHLHGHQATLWAASEEVLDVHERKRMIEAMHARRAKQVALQAESDRKVSRGPHHTASTQPNPATLDTIQLRPNSDPAQI